MLGQLRQKAGVSQKKLASILKWDQSYLSKIESGKRKNPSRNIILSIARILNLSEGEADELLFSAQYQPQSIFEMTVDDTDFSLKKHIGVLKEISEKAPMASYVKVREEIADFLELLRIKYLQKTNPVLSQNNLLADLVYSKVKRRGLRALYETVNHPQGGAIVIKDGKILLAKINISPLKNVWHIPAGFVNPKKGDKNAKDMAMRMVKGLTDAEFKVIKELTAEGEILEGINTTDFSVKLGFFPAVFQAFKIQLLDDKLDFSDNAKMIRFEDIPNLKEGIHPLLSQIIKPYVKNNKLIQKIYERGEDTINAILKSKNYRRDIKDFYLERIKKV